MPFGLHNPFRRSKPQPSVSEDFPPPPAKSAWGLDSVEGVDPSERDIPSLADITALDPASMALAMVDEMMSEKGDEFDSGSYDLDRIRALMSSGTHFTPGLAGDIPVEDWDDLDLEVEGLTIGSSTDTDTGSGIGTGSSDEVGESFSTLSRTPSPIDDRLLHQANIATRLSESGIIAEPGEADQRELDRIGRELFGDDKWAARGTLSTNDLGKMAKKVAKKKGAEDLTPARQDALEGLERELLGRAMSAQLREGMKEVLGLTLGDDLIEGPALHLASLTAQGLPDHLYDSIEMRLEGSLDGELSVSDVLELTGLDDKIVLEVSEDGEETHVLNLSLPDGVLLRVVASDREDLLDQLGDVLEMVDVGRAAVAGVGGTGGAAGVLAVKTARVSGQAIELTADTADSGQAGAGAVGATPISAVVDSVGLLRSAVSMKQMYNACKLGRTGMQRLTIARDALAIAKEANSTPAEIALAERNVQMAEGICRGATADLVLAVDTYYAGLATATGGAAAVIDAATAATVQSDALLSFVAIGGVIGTLGFALGGVANCAEVVFEMKRGINTDVKSVGIRPFEDWAAGAKELGLAEGQLMDRLVECRRELISEARQKEGVSTGLATAGAVLSFALVAAAFSGATLGAGGLIAAGGMLAVKGGAAAKGKIDTKQKENREKVRYRDDPASTEAASYVALRWQVMMEMEEVKTRPNHPGKGPFTQFVEIAFGMSPDVFVMMVEPLENMRMEEDGPTFREIAATRYREYGAEDQLRAHSTPRLTEIYEVTRRADRKIRKKGQKKSRVGVAPRSAEAAFNNEVGAFVRSRRAALYYGGKRVSRRDASTPNYSWDPHPKRILAGKRTNEYGRHERWFTGGTLRRIGRDFLHDQELSTLRLNCGWEGLLVRRYAEHLEYGLSQLAPGESVSDADAEHIHERINKLTGDLDRYLTERGAITESRKALNNKVCNYFRDLEERIAVGRGELKRSPPPAFQDSLPDSTRNELWFENGAVGQALIKKGRELEAILDAQERGSSEESGDESSDASTVSHMLAPAQLKREVELLKQQLQEQPLLRDDDGAQEHRQEVLGQLDLYFKRLFVAIDIDSSS